MSVYQRKNGKWYCRLQVHGERLHVLCHGATSKAEALDVETGLRFRLIQQQNGVLPRKENRAKLSKLLDMFEDYSIRNKRSFKGDIYSLRIIREYFKNAYADDITVAKLEKFKEFLLKRGLKNATVNRYKAILSKVFSLGMQNKLVKENPVRWVKHLRENNTIPRFLSKEEEERLMKALKTVSTHLKPLIWLGLKTGMRRSEIFNLKWKDIDFKYGNIHVLNTKSGKARIIPLAQSLREMLEQMDKSSEYVFVNPKTDKPYTDIKHSFHTVLKAANIKNFRFHDIRHTFATRLAACTKDLVIVQAILGHASIQTTMRYAHVIKETLVNAISTLDSLC